MNDNGFVEELNYLRERGLARSLSQLPAGVINLSSNDYLSLSRHPDVIEAACEAANAHGTGGASSRLLAGTSEVHRALESALARALEKETALVYSSGYHANTGILPALASSQDLIVFDRLSHASIIDGVKMSGAAFVPFKHNDVADLDRILSRKKEGKRRVFVVTEGIFSMDGDKPDLPALCDVARQHGAFVYLDEAHSFGLIGPAGRGLAAESGVLDRIDIHVGTLSKTLASQGGFVATRRDIADLLVSKSRSFLFTTALAPACAAAALAALNLLPALQNRRDAVARDAREVRERLQHSGHNTMNSQSAIVPVWTGTVEATRRLSDHLLSKGFFVPSIRPPTVPTGECRVRLSLTYREDRRWLAALVAAFEGERIAQAG